MVIATFDHLDYYRVNEKYDYYCSCILFVSINIDILNYQNVSDLIDTDKIHLKHTKTMQAFGKFYVKKIQYVCPLNYILNYMKYLYFQIIRTNCLLMYL